MKKYALTKIEIEEHIICKKCRSDLTSDGDNCPICEDIFEKTDTEVHCDNEESSSHIHKECLPAYKRCKDKKWTK